MNWFKRTPKPVKRWGGIYRIRTERSRDGEWTSYVAEKREDGEWIALENSYHVRIRSDDRDRIVAELDKRYAEDMQTVGYEY